MNPRSHFHALGRLATASVLLCWPFSIRAQQAAGSEFRVNTYTTWNQQAPGVASDGAGTFVVVWQGTAEDNSGFSVYGRFYSSSGGPLGSEFTVNSSVPSANERPRVVRDVAGDFAVVWQNNGLDGFGTGIFGRLFTSAGVPLGPEFVVNEQTVDAQESPRLASDADGDLVVVWESNRQDGSYFGIFGKRYSSAGVQQGGEFQVNTTSTGNQKSPAVASAANGDFAVVWRSTDGLGSGIWGRLYASDGQALTGEFAVNTYTTSSQGYPAIAREPGGTFIVAWNSHQQDGFEHGVFARRFSGQGLPLSGEMQVNTYTLWSQFNPAIAISNEGDFVVTWDSLTQDGADLGVFGQRFTSDGSKVGLEFQVNTYTSYIQYASSVALAPDNSFLVVWQSLLEDDGTGWGVYGQRFQAVTPGPITATPTASPQSATPTQTGSVPTESTMTPTASPPDGSTPTQTASLPPGITLTPTASSPPGTPTQTASQPAGSTPTQTGSVPTEGTMTPTASPPDGSTPTQTASLPPGITLTPTNTASSGSPTPTASGSPVSETPSPTGSPGSGPQQLSALNGGGLLPLLLALLLSSVFVLLRRSRTQQR